MQVHGIILLLQLLASCLASPTLKKPHVTVVTKGEVYRFLDDFAQILQSIQEYQKLIINRPKFWGLMEVERLMRVRSVFRYLWLDTQSLSDVMLHFLQSPPGYLNGVSWERIHEIMKHVCDHFRNVQDPLKSFNLGIMTPEHRALLATELQRGFWKVQVEIIDMTEGLVGYLTSNNYQVEARTISSLNKALRNGLQAPKLYPAFLPAGFRIRGDSKTRGPREMLEFWSNVPYFAVMHHLALLDTKSGLQIFKTPQVGPLDTRVTDWIRTVLQLVEASRNFEKGNFDASTFLSKMSNGDAAKLKRRITMVQRDTQASTFNVMQVNPEVRAAAAIFESAQSTMQQETELINLVVSKSGITPESQQRQSFEWSYSAAFIGSGIKRFARDLQSRFLITALFILRPAIRDMISEPVWTSFWAVYYELKRVMDPSLKTLDLPLLDRSLGLYVALLGKDYGMDERAVAAELQQSVIVTLSANLIK